MYLSTTIALVPDGTLLIQLGLFLVALGVLTTGILRPFVRVRDLRRAETVEAEAEARRLEAVAAERLEEYRRQLDVARQEGLAFKEQLRQAGYASAGGRIAGARKTALAALEAAKMKMAQEAMAARALLEAQTDEFARAIAERILERALGEQPRSPGVPGKEGTRRSA